MTALALPARTRQPAWRQLLGFNVLTGIVLAIIGWLIGYWLGGRFVNIPSLQYYTVGTGPGQNDISVFLGYLLGVIGFLAGLGFFNYPIKRMLGHPPSLAEHESAGEGWIRYFTLCTEHKVVAMQYLVGIGVFFFIGGINAMLIRTELLQPNVHVFGANQYLTLVGMHGSMMMGMMTSGVLGPFANWVVPLMIGSRRMAFPRIESFTFWLLMAAGVVLMTTVFFGGFQTGWTGYEPLGDQGTAGFDAYIAFFTLVGISMCLLGLNVVVTIATMRAPGMTWSRLPIFVWACFATGVLMMLAAPMLAAALLLAALDRTVQTAFYIPGNGGSSYLWENLFWVFGHPEVYIVALPGFGIVLELAPVFCRKPLWGYRLAVAGMLGVGLFSFFVWQHHLFVSGMNADLRPFFMLSTELISLPTGFIFVCMMGTMWRGRINYAVPWLFCMAWAFNFLWGGISGVFLSDAPSDVTTHGSFFSMAHFHYTIMGGLIFAVFAAIYYWGPKMTGFKFNERLAKIHFWTLFVFFNTTFAPLFALGFLGMPRRVVTYPANLQGLNDWVSASAYCILGSMCVFLVNLIWSMVIKREPAEDNPWNSKSPEFQLPTPVPDYDYEKLPVFDDDPYPYGVEVAPAAATAGQGA
ncbi:MAG TPA: cbb3-type cytochrome c oxidase subunit I [Solirubrobacteraceae bacterium]|nr:cbb3-type cytochrome c oxidase subunit I [Solirubrobacteraceae bacterium]